MSTETTKLLTESVIVFVDIMEIVSVILPVLGLCLCAALFIRETVRVRRGSRMPRASAEQATAGTLLGSLSNETKARAATPTC